jgi:hypothetical protein
VPSIRALAPTLIVDALCPFVAYKLVKAYRPDVPDIAALALSAAFPAVKGLLGLIQRRRVDFVGATVLTGIGVTIVAVRLGGSPQLLLIRESFVTAGLGVMALSSFAWRRPLLFYVGRQFTAGDDRAAIDRFNDLWQHERARRTFRVMTLVWAVAWLGEFGLRVAMVLTLPVAQVLVISPIVFNGITFGVLAWTFAYARSRRGHPEAPRATSDLAPQ